MRIIAGRFRHRALLANPGLVTRPITDRVKESLFARIEHRLPRARVADVFAGTGTLGLESLSRGAATVVFIEQDRKAVEFLRKNIATLRVEEAALCWPTDVWRTSFHPQRAEAFLPYDVVFFDPPYRMVSDLQPGTPLWRALQRLARPSVSAPEVQLIVRVPEHSHPPLPPEWLVDWTLTMSNMELLACRRTPGPVSHPPEGLVAAEAASMIHGPLAAPLTPPPSLPTHADGEE
jgi:16S rRNA (guanine966-N2)-methyltransferase